MVTERDLSEAQFRRLGAWLARAAESNPWVARLQLLFLIKHQVLTMNAKACLYQFGTLKRSGSDGNPIIWLNVLESGVVLFGPAVQVAEKLQAVAIILARADLRGLRAIDVRVPSAPVLTRG